MMAVAPDVVRVEETADERPQTVEPWEVRELDEDKLHDAGSQDSNVTVRLSQPLLLALPVVTLEGPAALVEPTPSPVPRVSLAPATGSYDAALVPTGAGQIARNVPTVVAHPWSEPSAGLVVRGTPAVTFPPGRARDVRIGKRLVLDVRSSKREIVLGLTIGMVLAGLFGVIGQRYVQERKRAHSPRAVPALAGSTQLFASGAEQREARALQPRASSADPGAHASVPESQRPSLEASAPDRLQAAGASASELGATESEALATRPSGSGERARGSRGDKAKRSKPKRVARSAPSAAMRGSAAGDPFGDEPRLPASEWTTQPERPGKSSLTPAESAGLGLDLTL